MAPLAPVLVGRVLDPDGAPVTSTRLRLRMIRTREDGVRTSSGSGTETDEEGRFRYVVNFDLDRVAGARFVVAPEADRSSPTLDGEVRLPDELPPGETDLGDLVLGPLPLLVSGTVIDEAGNPIPEVWIEVAEEARHPQTGEHRAWFSESDLRTRADGEGRFAIHGRFEDDVLGLKPWHSGYSSEEHVPVPVPATDVELVLRTGGDITGRILRDEGVNPNSIRIEAHPETAGGTTGHRGRLDREDAFHIQSLLPGSYAVRFFVRHSKEPLVEVPGVHVRAGEVTEDPRLAAVDLRGGIHVIRLTVLDAGGEPLPSAKAVYHCPAVDPPKHTTARSQREEPGLLRIESDRLPVDVVVFAPGYRTSHLKDLSSDETVTLEAGLPVRLVLADPEALPDEGYLLNASLVLPEETPFVDAPEGTFASDGHLTLHAAGTGTHRVQFWVMRAGRGGGFTGMGIWQENPVTIEVTETSSEQRFTVSVSPESVDDAASRL